MADPNDDRKLTSDLPLAQRPQVSDARMPSPSTKKDKGFQASDALAALNPVGPNVANVLAQSGQDADAAAAKGNYGQAMGSAARGLLATVPANIVDTIDKFAPVVAPIISGAKGFAAGLSGADVGAPATAPAAAAPAAPSVLPDPNRQVMQQAGMNPGGPQTGQPPTPQPTAPPTTGFDPSITKTVDAQGRTTYTNVTGDAGFAGRGAVSPQNEAAANSLATRYAAPGAAPAEGSAAPIVLADTGGYGLRDKGFLAAREQRMNLADQTAGLSADQAATIAQRAQQASEQNATARANSADTLTAHREGIASTAATAAAGLAANAPHLGAETRHAEAQAQLTGSQVQAANLLQQAKLDYGKALASGDEKATAAAEAKLRAAQGKWEKEQPDRNRVVVVPGGTIPDPNNPGQYIHQPSMVFDQGTNKYIAAPQQAGNAPAPKFETGKVYVDPTTGEKRKWDGSQFTPA